MAANVQALPLQFKIDLLGGLHNFNPTAAVFKAALYFQNSGLGVATTAYSATGEVGGTNYTAGGIVVPNATGPLSTSPTAYWTPSANLVWTALTISSPFDTVLIYNSTNLNRAVGVFTFPAQTITAGTFTITMPVNASTSALIQVS